MAKRLIASNWKDADHLDKGRWLQTFLETISMKGAALLFWKGVMRNSSYGEK